MITSEKFYMDCFYPLQDGIIREINDINTPFYLTGGTALSRCYFQHRYSEDLDFFVNQDKKYKSYIKSILPRIIEAGKNQNYAVDTEHLLSEENYTRINILKSDSEYGTVELKIDLINDSAPRTGTSISNAYFGKIDNLRNILTNKITALYRLEPKDIADIWILSKNMSFLWPDIIGEAKEKELGIDPISISKLIMDFPTEYLDTIKWQKRIDKGVIASDLSKIAKEILYGRVNSLAENS